MPWSQIADVGRPEVGVLAFYEDHWRRPL